MNTVLDPELLKTQLTALTDAHEERLRELQTRLVDAEKEADDIGHLDQYRADYAKSAERFASASREENRSYSEPRAVD